MMKKTLLGFFVLMFVLIPRLEALPEPDLKLHDAGTEFPVDYHRYGRFRGIGTTRYHYVVYDEEGLSKAVGEGIYPSKSIEEDPGFLKFQEDHPDGVVAWNYVYGARQDGFYAWNLSKAMEPGTHLFFMAEGLRRAGHIKHALKAYYAILVHYPSSYVWAYDKSYYWYTAPEAISRIRKLCALHPDLGLTLEGAFVDIVKKGHLTPDRDEVRVWPGRWEKADLKEVDVNDLRVIQIRGGEKIRLVQFENGHWQLRVDDKPFMIKGVTYTATKVGESAHALNLSPWMLQDVNRNGKNDSMFDSWVDENQNNKRDRNEPIVGDAKLLKDMGLNAIRYYHYHNVPEGYDPKEYNKDLMRTLHRDYGIYFILGDFLGAYTIGSGAAWGSGTDYTDPAQRARMMHAVEQMVKDHKDEPYVLMWLLGNENQQPATRTNAAQHPLIYAKFVDEVARRIKVLDPEHPVAIGNLTEMGLREIARYAPTIDIYGVNVYAGPDSMGSIVQQVKHFFDRPVMFTEWGADAYHEGVDPDENAQAEYIRGNWMDMEENFAGKRGEGNVIGGIVFEWMDEWWKTTKGDSWGDPYVHNVQSDFRAPFKDQWMHEEWLGIVGQGNGRFSPFQRHLREAYYELQELWKEESRYISAQVPQGLEDGYVTYEGVIEFIDQKTGDFVMRGSREGAGPEIVIKLKADPNKVYVSDVMAHSLEFSHLLNGDYVNVDCIIKDGEVTVDTVFLLTVREPY